MENLADFRDTVVGGFQKPAGLIHNFLVDESSDSGMRNLLRYHGEITGGNAELVGIECDVMVAAEMLIQQFAEIQEEFVGTYGAMLS